MRYRLLGRSGLRISELCLGTMSFGEDWGFGADYPTSERIIHAFMDRGGTFLDSANKYHNGQTETFVGKAIADRRTRAVLATKYTLSMDHSDPNAAGNGRKNLVQSVEASLKRLQTDYIDLLWLHVWDQITPIDEVMRALDDLVASGKVLYLGVSDTPAWVVAQANTLAQWRGWAPFVGLQVEYSLLERTVERDLLPMARSLGLGVTPWGPLAGGVLTGKYTRGGENDSLRKAGNQRRTTPRNLAIAKAVDAIADDIGATSAQVALAWARAQGPDITPIVGARKVSQIEDSLGCLDLTLSAEHLAKLDELSAIELGFPHQFLKADYVRDLVYGEQIKDRLDV